MMVFVALFGFQFWKFCINELSLRSFSRFDFSVKSFFFLSFCHADHSDFGRSNFFEWNVAHAIFSLCLFIICLRLYSIYLPTIWSIASVAYQDSYLSFSLRLSLSLSLFSFVFDKDFSRSHRSLCSFVTFHLKQKTKNALILSIK